MINKEDLFWISFQTNSTADMVNAKEEFGLSLQQMKETLKEDGFIFPHLVANMRNSQPISNITVEYEGTKRYNMSEETDKLTSSVPGQTPLLIPVNEEDVDK